VFIQTTLAVESEPEAFVERGRNLLGVYSSVGDTVLTHYEVRERIGEGGVALVYKARDTRLGRWVALKVLQPWAMGHAGFREQLIHEAQAASALNHPNIVTVHEVSTDETGVCFIVMEYIAGHALNAVIPARGLPIRKALDVAMQVGDALRTAEAAGIIHGDLKPQNIMVTPKGQVKLLDFGLAHARAFPAASGERLLAARFGTKAYMAPERLKRVTPPPSTRSDIFSFGLILHLLLTGRHPFLKGSSGETAVMQYDTPIILPARVSGSLGDVVHACLFTNPRQRFASMQELFDTLAKCASARPKRIQKRDVFGPNSKRPGGTSTDVQVRRRLGRIGYHNMTASRQTLLEVKAMLDGRISSVARKATADALAKLVVKGVDFGSAVPMSVRDFRKLILDVLVSATRGDLSPWFRNGQLENLDLYGMDFSGTRLEKVSFRGAFLAGASFARSNLADASFSGAWIRNVNFADARLLGADFSEADWFNALGLTEAQLRSARTDTFADCPRDFKMMHLYASARYGFPFASWLSRHQRELEAAWRQYLRPDGLATVIKGLRFG
jgi:serine/threonine protein kinase